MAFSQVESLAATKEKRRGVSRKDLFLRALRSERDKGVDPLARPLLRAHIIRGLFLYAPGILLIDAVAAVLAALVFWRSGFEGMVGAWLALALATCVLRWLHVLRYFNADPPRAEARKWSRLFTLGTLMSGVIWGIGNVVFYAPGNGILFVVQMFLVTGLSAAALAGYAANMPTFYAFVSAVVLPFGACLALDGIPAHLFTATLLAVWTSIIVFLAHLLNRHIADRILLLDRAMLTETMQAARDEAVAANQAKTRFIANVSHELRTPLNAIIGLSEVMSAELYGRHSVERYREYSKDIRNSGTYLLGLMSDLVDAAKLEAGRVSLNERIVDLGELIAHCEDQLRFAAGSAKVNLSTFVPQDLPHVNVDLLRIRQVLTNLLSNAVKFTPSGGRVSLVAAAGAAGVTITVKDNGIGMRRTDIAKAFEPFAASANTAPRGDISTGLGLALCKTLIEAHGGQISIESEHGVGTTATVLIPRARVVGPLNQNSELNRAA